MAELRYALHDGRACLTVAGEEATGFLQGLLSNDVAKADGGRAIYAALLTAQGRFLHDMLIARAGGGHGGGYLLDGEAARLDDLKRRLTMYKLRARVAIADARETLAVAVLWGAGAAAALGLPDERGSARALEGGVAFVDPRLAALGARAILPRGSAETTLASLGFAPAPLAEYQRQRMALGVPEGSADLQVEKALLMENGFEELNGVDFAKGCYVGQEITARMKHRALVKRRLFPVAVEGLLPAPGTPVTLDGDEAGEMRAGIGDVGLALLKLDAVAAAKASGAALRAGEARLRPRMPGWLASAGGS